METSQETLLSNDVENEINEMLSQADYNNVEEVKDLVTQLFHIPHIQAFDSALELLKIYFFKIRVTKYSTVIMSKYLPCHFKLYEIEPRTWLVVIRSTRTKKVKKLSLKQNLSRDEIIKHVILKAYRAI